MTKTRTRPRPSKTYQRYSWLPWVLVTGVVATSMFALRSGGADAPAPQDAVSDPVVGADLHSLAIDPSDPDTIYIGSHQGASVSHDGGDTWEVIESLDGADVMGWGFTNGAILVGGHPGISVSTDGGETFELQNEGLPSTDAHALGAGQDVIYAGLAGSGTFASTDGGASWEPRSEEVGAACMGRSLVDSADQDHVLAPDMQGGPMESSDGGRTWVSLGGVPSAMWVSWDESDTDHVIVTTQGAATETTDGGDTWDELEVPEGTSIVEFSATEPNTLYAAVLEDPIARIYTSRDGGKRWEAL